MAILHGAKTPPPLSCHQFNPVGEEGGVQPTLRCTVEHDGETDLPPQFQDAGCKDAVIQHMLSLHYISEKLGLAKHVLQATRDSVDKIYNLNHYNMYITHTGDTAGDTAFNTVHGINVVRHCREQMHERQMVR